MIGDSNGSGMDDDDHYHDKQEGHDKNTWTRRSDDHGVQWQCNSCGAIFVAVCLFICLLLVCRLTDDVVVRVFGKELLILDFFSPVNTATDTRVVLL